MSGWKVMVPLALAILAIFGVILLIYSIVGSGDASESRRRRSPTDTPVAIETPPAGAYFAAMSAILSDSTVDVLSSPIETP
jgi:hypothetical protein